MPAKQGRTAAESGTADANHTPSSVMSPQRPIDPTDSVGTLCNSTIAPEFSCRCAVIDGDSDRPVAQQVQAPQHSNEGVKMSRYSIVASFATAVLALGVIAPSALADQDDSTANEGVGSSEVAPPTDASGDTKNLVVGDDSDPGVPTNTSEATPDEGAVDAPDGGDAGLPTESDAPEVSDDLGDNAVQPPSDDAVVEGELGDVPESSLLATPAPMGIGTFPSIEEILNPSSLWPLPTGIATAEPDPVFKRGSSGYHDPFLVAGGFIVPNIDLLADPLKQALKGELCTNQAVTVAVDAMVWATTLQKILPTVLTKIDSKSPDAAGLCVAYVDSLTPSEILSLVPLDVKVTMTNRADSSDIREATVPFESGNFILGQGYVFAAMSTEFPGGYFNAGTYDIEAELMADMTVALPQTTVTTTVNWTGKNIVLWPPSAKTVTGVSAIDVTFPPTDVGYTFNNQPIAKLINKPTMTVVEAPTIDAAWDYSVGLRVNDEGYDGVVSGLVNYGGTLENYNQNFRTDLLLYRVGTISPVQRVSVALDENFQFSHQFVGLSQGNYYAIPVISSDRILPVPVTGEITRLQVLRVRADFHAPTLDCLQETGAYQLEGSVHNNEFAPVLVEVGLNGPDGPLGSQTVLPTRTHFDISTSMAGVGDYSATFSAKGAKSVTVAGPSVVAGECAAVVDLQWDPSEATNTCPAMTADSTLSGVVEGYRDGYSVTINVFANGAEEPFISETNVAVDENGAFSLLAEGLDAGTYNATVDLTYKGELVEQQSAELTVEVTECGALENVMFDPSSTANVCPANTADSTLGGKVLHYRSDDHTVGYELFVATGNEEDPWTPVEGRAGAIEVKEDGTFSLPITGLPAGEYTAWVTLMAGDESIDQFDVPLKVTVADCPKPKPTPDNGAPKKSETLPDTGAFVFPVFLVGVGALGAGHALKRRSRKI